MSTQKSHRKIFVISGIVIIAMFGFCFAMVPLFGLICRATGINTSAADISLSTPAAANEITTSVDKSREITVQFIAMNHMGMPWDFYPQTKVVNVHPGEKTKIFFYAKNPTGLNMSAQAIPSMTPTDAITHFHKIQCFCFNQQTLKAGEDRKMAMIFQIDKDLPKDIHVITLAYTLFDTTPKLTRKE
ncbi:MAG: cytochrome c oxidase assembly protein [Gammaproteobacteria bacterium]|nr:cytochrome c oxidase assembly protein [Gammaproteobacteria bacterium]